MNDELKLKISLSEKGKIVSPETIDKLKISLKGRKAWNKGTIGIMKPNTGSFKKGRGAPSNAPPKGCIGFFKDCKHTEKSKQQMREKKLGKNLGKKRSLETCKKISEGKMGEKNPMWKNGSTDKRKYAEKRRKLVRSAKGSHTETEWTILKNWYHNQCLCCFKKNIELVKDHIIPLSLGGSNDIMNIQPLCRRCNAHKYTKTIDYRFIEDDKLLKEIN